MESTTVGSTVLDTVRSNLICIRWNGALTAADVNAIREYTSALQRELGDDVPIYAYVKIGEGVQIKNEARKAIMTLSREHPWAAIAVVGARYEIKVLLQLTINAITLLVKDTALTSFVDTEEQALAWLDEVGAASSTPR